MTDHGIRSGVRRLLRLPLSTTSRAEADADEELRVFIAERVDSLKALGYTDADARAEALRRLGVPLEEAA
ncbi:MAG TPA: permease prefix domain 1-containing protein, partial [Steroidobacteraceae bacterium]|nr:permease prefix domain 1-containing protein [Steroidobacteraceae bacterium]